MLRLRLGDSYHGRTREGDLKQGVKRMVDVVSYALICVACVCFGLIVSFQLAHINYCRKLATLVRRSISTKTIAPVLVEYELQKSKQ